MIKSIYILLLRLVSDFPLKKMGSRIFLLPDYVLSISLLLISLISSKIGHLEIDFPRGLMLFVFFQSVTFILFSPYRPITLTEIEEIKAIAIKNVNIVKSIFLVVLLLILPLTILILLF